jgi:phosphate transport system substrate-binding protein
MAVLAIFSLSAAACSDDDDGGTSADDSVAEDGQDSGEAADVSGEVVVSGSSTVEPISIAVAESFAEVAPDVDVSVDGPGTGDGFELFCNGETDISDASRPIEAEEIEACEANGVEFIELEVAIDGLSVLTNPANEVVECLTFNDLYALVGPESEGFANWSDGQELASELGSSTELPDAALDITAPGEESGTYDSFIEIALGDPAEARVEAGAITEDEAETTRPDYTSQADDNAIITGIEGSDSSFGWVGFAFAEEAGDGVKEIEIDGGDGCVGPTAETIADGSYPLSRSLYIYVSKASADDNPAVAAYVDYYLGDGIGAVEEVGYVSIPEDRLATSQETWDARQVGSLASEG